MSGRRVVQSMNPKAVMGDWDASSDELLAKTFTTFFDEGILLDPETNVVLAGKGAGKTALVKKLVSYHRDSHITVSADDIAFNRVFEQWTEIRNMHANDARKLVEAWKTFFFAIVMVHLYFNRDIMIAGGVHKEYFDVFETFLKRGLGIPERSLVDRRKLKEFIAHASAQFLKAITLGHLDLGGGIDASSVMRERTVEQQLARATEAVGAVLRAADKTVLITFDEFDSFFESQLANYMIDEASQATVQEILLSLLQAVKELKGLSAAQRLRVKVLFPRDKFPAHYRDRVKTLQHAVTIFWNPEKLFLFCCRRLAFRLGEVGSDGQVSDDPKVSWFSLFPHTVQNRGRSRQKQEHCFDYLLRHTHYRPRDLQIQISSIFDEHRSKTGRNIPESGVIPDEIIRNGVSRGNREIADAVIDEFKAEHPYLPALMAAFRGFPTVFRYDSKVESVLGKCVKRIQDNTKRPVTDPSVAMNVLMYVGFLGRFDIGPAVEEDGGSRLGLGVRRVDNRPYKSTFYFSDRYGLAPTVAHDDWLCIHPVFHEMYESEPSGDYIVGGALLEA